MAKALGVEAESIDGAQEVKADLLFLGCAVLGGNARPEMERFVEGLDSGSVSRVALFSSNGYGTDQFAALREKLKAKGIEVEDAGVFLQRKRIYIQKHGKAGSGRSGGSKAVCVIRQGWQKELTNG